MKLLIKFPTRNRPAVFQRVFERYRSFLSGKHPVEFVISMDENDTSMNNDEIKAKFSALPNVKFYYGNSKCKVEAINANMEGHEYDVLLLASDDMIPVQRGFDDVILTKMQETFPDTHGVLHFNDGRVGQVLNTLSVMGKKMYEDYGYIYHPDYVSLWCDNEFQDTSVATGRVKYFEDVIITHQWINITGRDPLHIRNETFYELDKKVFELRKRRGFPKESVLNDLPDDVKEERKKLLAR